MRIHFTLARILVSLAVLAYACTGSNSFAQAGTPAPQIGSPTLPPKPTEPVPALPPLKDHRFQGMIIRDIQFRGLEEDNRVLEQLKDIIGLKVGQQAQWQQLRKSMQALYATGRFADLRAEAQETAPNQITLVFVAEPNYFVGSMNAEGAPKKPTNSQLIDSAKLHLGEVVTEAKIKQAIERMQAVLRENGYYRATVGARLTSHPDTQTKDVVFEVAPGDPATVGKVLVQGNPGYTVDEVADIAHLRPGDRVTQDRVAKALERLRKRYSKQERLESQISIIDRKYHEDTNELDYTLRIERGPTVDVHVEGASISSGKMKKLIPVYEENAVDNDLLNEGRRNLRDYLQTKGYFDAKVNFNQDFVKEKDHLHVIYDVEQGEKHDLTKVNFDIKPGEHIASGMTGPYFAEDALRERLQVQPQSLILSHGRFSQAMMNQDVDNLAGLYASNGFLSVKVEAKAHDDVNGKQGNMAVTYKIDEGPQTRVGKLTVEGNATFPQDQLPLINTAEGQAYSDANIALDRDEVLNFYFNKGFPNTTFDAKVAPTPGVPNSMDVTFVIIEGQQFFIDRILTSQLDFTRPSVVAKQFEIKPGDALSQSQMSQTQSNLYNLGVFNEVRMAVQNPDGDAKYKDVLMQFQEAKRWTFNYGLGLEASTGQPDQQSCLQLAQQGQTSLACSQGRTGVSPRATFDVSRINFRGLAHTLSFKTTIGRLQKRALASYEAPRWFGSPKWTLTFSAIYDNSINVTTFTSERLEGSITAENRYSRVSQFLYRLTYRRVKASNVVVSPDQIPLYSAPVRVGMPSFSYIRDKRDDPLETKNGNFTTFDTGVSSRYFGSQASFTRFLIQNSTYHPFKKKNANANARWVFARNLRIGVEEPFGNDFIPLPERFFAGGSNNMRGFALNQAGPRDLKTGTPLGGYAVVVNSMELRTPPVVLPFVADNLSFAFFHDAGNVFNDGKDMVNSLFRWHQPRTTECKTETQSNLCSFSYISHAVGTGIRYRTPIGPVRVDFGYNLNPTVYPSFEPDANNNPVFVPRTTRRLNVFFSIGQTF